MLSIRQKIFDILTLVGIAAAAFGLVIYPTEMVSAASDGITLCLNVIIPSLFPFFVLSSLIVKLGWAERLGRLAGSIMKPVFNVSGTCASALILGFIGGYPVGAKTIISIYEKGECTKTEAERMLAFCNNSGPAFILGVVGAGIFGDSRIGILLYLTHFAASVTVGVLFRRWGKDSAFRVRRAVNTSNPSLPTAFTESVKESFSSVIGLAGFVIFFTVLIKLLFYSGLLTYTAKLLGILLTPLGLNASYVEKLLTGIIELTSGVWSLSGSADALTSKMAMAAFMLGWAGISVHFQTMSFMAGSGLSVKSYIAGKFMHGVISAVYTVLVSRFINFNSPVSLYLIDRVNDVASLDFVSAMKISCFLALGLAVIFYIVNKIQKNCGKKL